MTSKWTVKQYDKAYTWIWLFPCHSAYMSLTMPFYQSSIYEDWPPIELILQKNEYTAKDHKLLIATNCLIILIHIWLELPLVQLALQLDEFSKWQETVFRFREKETQQGWCKQEMVLDWAPGHQTQVRGQSNWGQQPPNKHGQTGNGSSFETGGKQFQQGE